MKTKLETEIKKIVDLYAAEDMQSALSSAIHNLLEKNDQGAFDDQKIDVSHISERQTNIFDQGA